eukprot:scaffold35248_cov76-Phaeocystis_antarctica.AAC.3
MTHHSREQYVGPATTSSVWQPARKTGKQASDCWMLPWSMHALSCGARRGARMCRAYMRLEGAAMWASATSQSVGSLPVVSSRCFAQRDTTACLAPGASFSSLHEWLRKAVTSPIAAGSVRSCSVGPAGGAVPAGGQAAEELRGAFEGGVGIGAADERRDRRRLLRLGAAPAQAPQAAVDAATIAGRGEGGTQEGADDKGRLCPVINEVVSLGVVCDADCSEEHAVTQEEEAAHGPQPPQGGAGLHGAIAAAAQRGGERADAGEHQRSTREAKCIWEASGECCNDAERHEPRPQDDDSGAHDADRACIGGEEGEEEEAEAQRVRNEPPIISANGGLDRPARREHDRRGQADLR